VSIEVCASVLGALLGITASAGVPVQGGMPEDHTWRRMT